MTCAAGTTRSRTSSVVPVVSSPYHAGCQGSWGGGSDAGSGSHPPPMAKTQTARTPFGTRPTMNSPLAEDRARASVGDGAPQANAPSARQTRTGTSGTPSPVAASTTRPRIVGAAAPSRSSSAARPRRLGSPSSSRLEISLGLGFSTLVVEFGGRSSKTTAPTARAARTRARRPTEAFMRPVYPGMVRPTQPLRATPPGIAATGVAGVGLLVPPGILERHVFEDHVALVDLAAARIRVVGTARIGARLCEGAAPHASSSRATDAYHHAVDPRAPLGCPGCTVLRRTVQPSASGQAAPTASHSDSRSS